MTLVRVASFEVRKIHGDHKEVFKRWFGLSDMCQQVVNTIWETWLVSHVQNKSRTTLKAFLDELRAWREAGSKKTDKPKIDFSVIDKELAREIYKVLTDEFPHCNIRVLTLLQQSTTKLIKTRKAASGNLSGSWAILLNRESIPSSTRAQPIPFDRANARIIPPTEADGNWSLSLRIDRVPQNGSRASSTEDRFEINTKGFRMRSQVSILNRITSGDYKFCGSALQWSKSKNRWFAMVCYQMPQEEKSELDNDKVAVLHASKTHPWSLRLNGRSIWIGGAGRHVDAVRRQVMVQRRSRQANYRFAGSANKGHGRNRALQALFRLQRRWKDFVKTYNHTVTHDLVSALKEREVGKLVYIQPNGNAKSRFLAVSGKTKRRESSSWDWFQVGAQLGYKCQEAGIELVVRKGGGE